MLVFGNVFAFLQCTRTAQTYLGAHQLVGGHLGEEVSSLTAYLGVGGVTEEVQ